MKVKYLLIFIFILLISTNYTIVYASDEVVQSKSIDDAITGADDFIRDGKTNSSIDIDEGKLKNASDTVYNIFFSIGVVVAVIMASVLGIQFMIGSAEEKANVKEKLVPFLIGCVIVFASFGIWKIVVTIGNNLQG